MGLQGQPTCTALGVGFKEIATSKSDSLAETQYLMIIMMSNLLR